jgi:hypothetical protein
MTTTTTATATKFDKKTGETKAISAYCDVCTNNDFDTEKALVSAGWELSQNYQFCPVCAVG